MKTNPVQIRPYREGQAIKIHLVDTPGNFICTFGTVRKVGEDNIPIVKYEDHSGLKLQQFKRFVRKNEIIMKGKFPRHTVIPFN